MLNVGDRVRDPKFGVTGKVISIHNVRGQGPLAVIRLEKEDLILGTITTAFEREVEILDPAAGRGIDSERDPLRSRALATRTGTTARESE